MSDQLSTFVQIGGSLTILLPFVLVQIHRLRPDSLGYIWPNFIGSSVLAADALHGHQWGFLLLEGVWAAVSLLSLLRRGTHGHR